MSKEHAPRPKQPFLDTITEQAKEIMLWDGAHQPTLFLKGSQETMIHPIMELPSTSQERRKMMFVLGTFLTKIEQLGALEEVILVTEAWMSKAIDEHAPQIPPSKDPNRIEVLVINQIDLATNQSQLRLLEMIRDDGGELVELKTYSDVLDDQQGQSSDSPLLNAFVAGYRLIR